MNQDELILDLIKYEAKKLTDNVRISDEAFDPSDYGKNMTIRGVTACMDNWFYSSFTVLPEDQDPKRMENLYFAPMRLNFVRSVQRLLTSRVRATLAKSEDLNITGRIFGYHVKGHGKLITLSRGPQIGSVVEIAGHRYGVVETGDDSVLFDRPLAESVPHETPYIAGLTEQPVDCHGATLLLTPIREIRQRTAKGLRIDLDFMAGVHLDVNQCTIALKIA